MDIKIHVQGIATDHVREPDEESGALFAGLLELDGNVYDRVADIKLEAGETFTTVVATLIPGDVEIVNHDSETWAALLEQNDLREREYKRQGIRNAQGRTVAIVNREGT